MKQEITRQMAEEMVDEILMEANRTFNIQKNKSVVPHLYTEEARTFHNWGWLKAALANAILKGQLSKEDLGIK